MRAMRYIALPLIAAINLLLNGCVATTGTHTGLAHVTTELARRAPTVATPLAASTVNLADGLNADEAVALALANNAAFREALADLGFTFADLEQARLIQNPVLSFLFPFPIGSKVAEGTIRSILDGLRFRKQRIAIAEVASRRVAERLVQNGLDLIRDVRVAYADLTAARRRMALVELQLANQENLVELMNARFTSGDASKLEVAVFETEAGRLAEDIPRQHSIEEQAVARLRALIGKVQSEDAPRFTDTAPPAGAPPAVATLVSRALAARPEASAAVLAVQEAGRRAHLADREIISLTAILDANFNPGDFELGPGFDATLPIFNKNEGARSRARAEIERARAAYVTVRDRIAREVREAEARTRRALEVLASQRQRTIPVADNAESLANRAHALGEASLVVVLEARRQRFDASVREIDALAELTRAWAELERAVGEKITPAPSAHSE